MQPGNVHGTRFTVVGAARSGLAVVRILRRHGGDVFVSESAAAVSMQEARTALDAAGATYEFGGHTARVLDADVIVLSPGVPSTIPIVREALHQGKRVVSELETASWFCRGPILAVTGTNGKTTTTTLAGRMLADARRGPVVAGNIGLAFSDVVEQVREETPVVLEVSSFQLDHVETFRPRVSMLLNITPDHLDRYDHQFNNYIASKRRVFMNQGSGDAIIYNMDDAVTRTAVEEHAPAGVTLLPFSMERTLTSGAWVERDMLMASVGGHTATVIEARQMSLRGNHNRANALAAATAALLFGVSPASVRATLRNFRGVEHRLEFVREKDGVTYVNDSKATNVDSVWYALQSFEQPVVLLLGGRDKGNDYSRLRELVRAHARSVIAIGESAEKVVSAFADIVGVSVATNMEEAVRMGARQAQQGDVVLLSPACASFDWFRNYEDRGRIFKEIVRGL